MQGFSAKPFQYAWILLLLSGLVASSAIAEGDKTEVPIRKIVLFSSGVGYFEHLGEVEGDAHTELRFRTAQINDILKSLILQDLDGGLVRNVIYPSQAPLSKTLRSFQIDIRTNPSLAELLNQVRGAEVAVGVHGETIQGTILGLEKRMQAAGTAGTLVETWKLNLITSGSIWSVALDDVQKIELQDAELRDELNRALGALAEARDQDQKPVTIHFEGQGKRRVRLAYVVETPVWKTSYRLILPDNKDDKAKLQGWAIVENQTDTDWNDVQLSLFSGRPISFVQDLYQPLYASRPVVQPDMYAGLSPQVYVAGRDGDGVADAAERGGGYLGSFQLQSLAKSTSPARRRRGLIGGTTDGGSVFGGGGAGIDATASVAAAVSAGRIGELFEYSVGSVSLPRQRSAMIPIINSDVEVERVSIYNKDVLDSHPLNGARLTNTTGNHLLQGPITVFDGGAYAGDARIDDLPPGQERLLSYAIDLDVDVTATSDASGGLLQSGKIVKGVLEIKKKFVHTQKYALTNNADRDRRVIIEHKFRPGWKLVDRAKPKKTTDTHYRFKKTVRAGKSAKFIVTEEFVQQETIAILSGNISGLLVFHRAGEIPKKVREALAEAISRKQALEEIATQIKQQREGLSAIDKEQKRIRSNMNTVSKNTAYYNRLLKKLDDQETHIEDIQADLRLLEKERDKQRRDLEEYLADLTVG